MKRTVKFISLNIQIFYTVRFLIFFSHVKEDLSILKYGPKGLGINLLFLIIELDNDDKKNSHLFTLYFFKTYNRYSFIKVVILFIFFSLIDDEIAGPPRESSTE